MRSYQNDELFPLLKDCYFHPSRDRNYKNKDVKSQLIFAMITLWKSEKIDSFGKAFFNRAIRNIIINEMMPEHLDLLIEMLGGIISKLSDDELAGMIVMCVLYDKKFLQKMLAVKNFTPKENKTFGEVKLKTGGCNAV